MTEVLPQSNIVTCKTRLRYDTIYLWTLKSSRYGSSVLRSSVLRWISSNGHQPVTVGASCLGRCFDESVNSAETGGRS